MALQVIGTVFLRDSRQLSTFQLAQVTSAMQRFEQHTAAVKAYIPADRLLVYEVKKDGGRCANSSSYLNTKVCFSE
jgi:hypothetical protein